MSRFDGEIKAASEANVELEELLAAFGTVPKNASNRNDAMAQYLSGAEGWRDAMAALRGAFAGTGKVAAGLTDSQDK